MRRAVALSVVGVALAVAIVLVSAGQDDGAPFAEAEQLRERELLAATDLDLPLLVYESLPGPDDPSVARRTLWLVEYTNFEVGNGGFVQYFHNTQGEYVEDTLAALERIEARGHADIFRAAAERWREERSLFEAARSDGGIDAFSKLYDLSTITEFDDQWFEVPVEHAEARWIRAHIDEFHG